MTDQFNPIKYKTMHIGKNNTKCDFKLFEKTKVENKKY